MATFDGSRGGSADFGLSAAGAGGVDGPAGLDAAAEEPDAFVPGAGVPGFVVDVPAAGVVCGTGGGVVLGDPVFPLDGVLVVFADDGVDAGDVAGAGLIVAGASEAGLGAVVAGDDGSEPEVAVVVPGETADPDGADDVRGVVLAGPAGGCAGVPGAPAGPVEIAEGAGGGVPVVLVGFGDEADDAPAPTAVVTGGAVAGVVAGAVTGACGGGVTLASAITIAETGNGEFAASVSVTEGSGEGTTAGEAETAAGEAARSIRFDTAIMTAPEAISPARAVQRFVVGVQILLAITA